MKVKIICLVFIFLISVFCTGCSSGEDAHCEDILPELLAVSGEDFEGNGEIYFGNSAEGELGYLSESMKAKLYGESEAELAFSKIEDYALFLSSRVPGEIAIFKCYSASDTDTVAAMCLERADTLKVALRGSEWEGKSEKIRVTIHRRYVVMSFTDHSQKVIDRFRSLV